MTRRTPCGLARVVLAPLLVAAIPGGLAAADPIRWRTDYDAARKEARDKGWPLLLEVGTESCTYCRKMDATTFQDSGIQDLVNGAFVPLKVDANANPELAQALRVQMYPTTVIAAPDGKIHAFLQGYVGADQLRDHAGRAALNISTPDWVARDLDGATRAAGAGDYARAVTLLKGVVAESRPSPARTKAEAALEELEKQAVGRLAHAADLQAKGESAAASAVLGDLMNRYGGTKAATDAAARLAGSPDRMRVGRADELLALARESFRAGRHAECLEQCRSVGSRYPDAPAAGEATRLAAQIEADPERLAAAAEEASERAAALQLTLAESWARKGRAKEAAAALEKVARLAPNTRHAEQASAKLALLKGQTDAALAGHKSGE